MCLLRLFPRHFVRLRKQAAPTADVAPDQLPGALSELPLEAILFVGIQIMRGIVASDGRAHDWNATYAQSNTAGPCDCARGAGGSPHLTALTCGRGSRPNAQRGWLEPTAHPRLPPSGAVRAMGRGEGHGHGAGITGVGSGAKDQGLITGGVFGDRPAMAAPALPSRPSHGRRVGAEALFAMMGSASLVVPVPSPSPAPPRVCERRC
jgi:hypothetical protein